MYPSLGLGISTAFGDARELAKSIREGGIMPSATVQAIGDAAEEQERQQRAKKDEALATYSRNRIPLTW